ncbi:MAG TPA: hypothetical protein GX405_16200 [Rhizobiales bacterium]|nr:hypothetical protein [Hyphomicrobiales bacterium]
MAGTEQDRGTFRGIARTLLALALLAERAAGRSFPVRFLVLALLFRAEAIARRFIARAIGAGRPAASFPDLPCLDVRATGPTARRYGAADALLLALNLRMLAAVLGALDEADESCHDLSAGRAGWSPRAPAAPDRPLLVVFGLAAAHRRPSRPP